MTIFNSRGFDTIIGKGTLFQGQIAIAPNSTTVIDGEAQSTSIMGMHVDGKVSAKTTLRVSGRLVPSAGPAEVDVPNALQINVQNVIITGYVECDTITVEGTLAIQSGATLKAKKILYRNYVSEKGAIVLGNLCHLDHVSEGEQV